MAATVIRNEAIAIVPTTTVGEYFFAPNFSEIENEPVYNELADLLEEVRASELYHRTGFGIETRGFITGDVTDDVRKVLNNPELIITNSLDVSYYKHNGKLYLRIPYVVNLSLDRADGWNEEFMQRLARTAGKVVIGLVSRAVNQVLVHNGIFYDIEKGSDYQWSGKQTCSNTIGEFDSKKYKIMGICKEPRESVKYESDGDGFLFEDRQTSQAYWATHNTVTGGYVDDDVMIQAFGASNYYGRI
jgi:hypothetical protein